MNMMKELWILDSLENGKGKEKKIYIVIYMYQEVPKGHSDKDRGK